MNTKKIQPDEIASILEQELESFSSPQKLEEVGSVLQVSDGIALVYGLTEIQVGEVVSFDNGQKGLALNLEENHVGVVVLGSCTAIKEGSLVKRTHKVASLPVGEGLLGRVVNALGTPIDGKGPLAGKCFPMPLERKAPGVIYREPVSEPLPTGITMIDTMIPIGKGQRQLIIGDRQTGKTTLILDTIINQRASYEAGSPVFCIYVAIGKRASSIAQVAATLKRYGAMEYTAIVAATAATPAPLQFLAPFAGAAIGEFFRDTGRHALVIYDDLSKQAVAYREISLLLQRPPGREAYPGDIFYLHSRLLERAAKLNRNTSIVEGMNDLPPSLQGKVRGGGSLTALPIIETQESEVSDYIPTNVISITDGQIFLENKLFNAGIRPAINIGISVSRVGGAAQTQAMKKVAGTLKLDYAQFMELESFAKFGSELDATTQQIIQRGRKTQLLLKQPPYMPLSAAQQIVTIYLATQGYLDPLPMEKVRPFAEGYYRALLLEHSETLKKIEQGLFDAHLTKVLDHAAKETIRNYS